MISVFEKRLKESLEYYKNNELLYEAFSYSLQSGGKRVRPMLCLLLADALKKDYEKVMPIAIAIEYIHTYSLVHDDLPAMDNDKYRRGVLTTHAKYGEYMGVLTGDALLTEAFSVIVRSNLKNKVQIIDILTSCAGINGMIYGQYLDMKFENEKIDLETLNLIHKNKTGALIKACFLMVLTEFEIESKEYIRVSELLGRIYQIQDDIFDSKDEKDKSNFIRLYGYENTMNLLKELKDEMFEILKEESSLKEYIIKIIEREK